MKKRDMRQIDASEVALQAVVLRAAEGLLKDNHAPLIRCLTTEVVYKVTLWAIEFGKRDHRDPGGAIVFLRVLDLSLFPNSSGFVLIGASIVNSESNLAVISTEALVRLTLELGHPFKSPNREVVGKVGVVQTPDGWQIRVAEGEVQVDRDEYLYHTCDFQNAIEYIAAQQTAEGMRELLSKSVASVMMHSM